MASKNTSSNSRQAVQRSNSDSARWIAGLLLLFIGLFAAAAVFFSFFSWAADQSGLQKSVEERVTLGIEPENLCGWAGARLGMLLVDHSFGLFGILIPAMIVLVGVRIVRQRPLLFNHSILSLFLIMILGSLTLGFAFADRWSLCCSTGWGGAFGIASSALLRTHIGAFGTLILLVGGWILTGVFINRNFINKVNEAGNVVVDKSGKVVEILKHKVVLHGRAAGEDGAAEDVPEPAPKPGPKAAAPQPAPSKAAEPAAQKPAPIRVERPSESVAARKSVPEEDENPFLELTPDGKPVARGDCRGAGAPSRGGRGVHRGGPFASRGPCGDRPQRAGRAGTPCGARRRACGACPGGGSGEGGRTVRSRCALYRDHRAGRRARRGARRASW